MRIPVCLRAARPAPVRADTGTMSACPKQVPLNASRRRLMPTEPLVTRVRIIDAMFPIVRGGTYTGARAGTILRSGRDTEPV